MHEALKACKYVKPLRRILRYLRNFLLNHPNSPSVVALLSRLVFNQSQGPKAAYINEVASGDDEAAGRARHS